MHFRILTDSFLGPMQEKLEEWKKTAGQLEKDHSKGNCFLTVLALIKEKPRTNLWLKFFSDPFHCIITLSLSLSILYPMSYSLEVPHFASFVVAEHAFLEYF